MWQEHRENDADFKLLRSRTDMVKLIRSSSFTSDDPSIRRFRAELKAHIDRDEYFSTPMSGFRCEDALPLEAIQDCTKDLELLDGVDAVPVLHWSIYLTNYIVYIIYS